MSRLSSDNGLSMEEYFFESNEESQRGDRVFALVIYDIVENRKRTRFAKFMKGYGMRIQKSCFEVTISHKVFEKLLQNIGKYCDSEDSIRVYRIHGRGQVYQWGRKEEVEDEDVVIL